MNLPSKKLIYIGLALVLGAGSAAAQNTVYPLKRGFENPPEGARPRVPYFIRAIIATAAGAHRDRSVLGGTRTRLDFAQDMER